ncbi:MAG TPA: four helix bundle protein [Cyclobacteriaceae bacterium]|nr:four helix bundle protein [Cyclobacteriaceae bacterium]
MFWITTEGSFSREFGLRDQINRSSASIMSNIAEGFERDGSKEFIQFLSIAKGFAGEARSLVNYPD